MDTCGQALFDAGLAQLREPDTAATRIPRRQRRRRETSRRHTRNCGYCAGEPLVNRCALFCRTTILTAEGHGQPCNAVSRVAEVHRGQLVEGTEQQAAGNEDHQRQRGLTANQEGDPAPLALAAHDSSRAGAQGF